MELRAEKIKKRYFRNTKNANYFYAVKDTDFTLSSGHLIEITGRSGSGKSTLLSMLAGLLEPTEGKVFFNDVDLYALDDISRSKFRNLHFGIIPQGHTVLQSLTVAENIKLPCTIYGESVSEDRVIELLNKVGIGYLKDAYPDELSGGEMRRLAIARAMIRKPDIILADEPTGDLDDENTHAVLQLLKQASAAGAAILLVTHEREAAAYADDIYYMNNGGLTHGTQKHPLSD